MHLLGRLGHARHCDSTFRYAAHLSQAERFVKHATGTRIPNNSAGRLPFADLIAPFFTPKISDHGVKGILLLHKAPCLISNRGGSTRSEVGICRMSRFYRLSCVVESSEDSIPDTGYSPKVQQVSTTADNLARQKLTAGRELFFEHKIHKYTATSCPLVTTTGY